MPEVTIIIPVGPYHEQQAERAIASAHNQTIPVTVDAIHDPEGHGPGWARNVGIDRCQTPFLMFLDADDWLEDQAANVFLYHAKQYPGQYIYSDWWVGEDRVVEAPEPCDAWRGGTVNNLTSLIPTQWAIEVGGFDQSLPGGEDTDFFLKLITAGCCGIRVDTPLVHYTPEGRRSQEYKNSPDYEQVHHLLSERYSGMAGCCDDRKMNMTNTQDAQPGDVYAIPTWGGNQNYTGRATGRRYGRQGNRRAFMCDPRDIEASRRPYLLEKMQVGAAQGRPTVTQPVGQGGQPVPPNPGVAQRPGIHGAQELGTAMFGRVRSGAGARYTPPKAVVNQPRTVEQIQAMAMEDEGDEE